MPQVVTDERAGLVWQGHSDPFGKLDVNLAKRSINNQVFDMKLRLPGQVHDEETGLYQNYYRDYNPSQGRYVTADPIGLGGGTNPYEYAGSNPLVKIDPLGLYQSDVHYYMTYFLAITAGLGAEDARVMALATQYIDDNPDTQPVDETNLLTMMASPLWSQSNLARYHFTLWTQKLGKKPAVIPDRSLNNPLGKSQQLRNLLGYAVPWGRSDCTPNYTSLQFMGGFLHAFEDTFAHRERDNLPYGINAGFGHATGDISPDRTYNHSTFFGGAWTNNESRTLAMELAVYKQITQYMKSMNYIKYPDRLGKVTLPDNKIWLNALKEFNACQADEHSDKAAFKTACNGRYPDPAWKQGGLAAKIQILNDALAQLGYKEKLIWSPNKVTNMATTDGKQR